MIPARFDYDVAESVEHAVSLLSGNGDTRLLAGGQSLLPAMRLRLARPSLLVDIGRLDDLSYVRDAGTHVAIGALTRHQDVARDPLLAEACGLVSHAAGRVGDHQVRHRGTIGGAIAYGDPASDLAAVALAVNAELVVRGPDGERTIPADAFFTGPFETALGPAEMLVEVRVPKLAAMTGWAYEKAHRRSQDWATAGVMVVVHRSDGGVDAASIALVSMGGTPLRAGAAEDALSGGGSPSEAAALVVEGTEPSTDHAGSAEYRAHLVQVLAMRAIEQALAG